MVKKLSILLLVCVLLISLVGCFNGNKKMEAVDKQVQAEAEKIGEVTPVTEPTVDTNKDIAVSESEQRVGKPGFGYFNIPKDFKPFIEEGASNPDALMQFARPDSSFIVTVTYVPKAEGLTVEAVANNMMQGMTSDGPSVVMTEAIIQGQQATALYQHYDSDSTTLNVYLFEEPDVIKYLAIEYDDNTDGESIKDNILETYALEK